jgi:hypothetical protein
MAGVLQHLRSSTLNKRPNPASMVDGQLAINYASGSPGAFFKDSNGNLVKVGPVHVGATAPNVSPASGGTAGNSLGEQWLDTSGGTYVFKIWDGASWRSEAGEFVNVTGDTMTGALGVIAGSASTPGLFFSGDANSGLYSPGADQVAISTNGTGRLFVDSNGNVGINTANTIAPGGFGYAREFALTGATSGDSAVAINLRGSRTVAGGFVDINFWHQSTSNRAYIQARRGSSDSAIDLDFITSGGAGMRLDSSGRLGLGTSSPGFKLTIEDATTPRIRIGDGTRHLNIDGGSATQNAAIGTDYAGSFGIYTNGAANTRLHVTSAGNVGIGTTSPGATLDVSGTVNFKPAAGYNALFQQSSTTLRINYLNDAGSANVSATYRATDFAWQKGDGGEVARIDSSGRLLVGTSSSSAEAKFIVQGGATAAGGAINIQRNATTASAGSTIGYISFANSANDAGAFISADGDGTWSAGTSHPTLLKFSTTADGASSPTERMRITQSGEHAMFSNSGTFTVNAYNASAAGTINVLFQGRHSATGVFSGTQSFVVYTNGNVQNTNGSYGTISDEKLKENIVDANSQWADLKAIKIRNWNFKEETGHGTHRQIGPIAQELENVCPGLVFETPDRDENGNETEEVTKGVNQSVLYMKAVKALQEAMERIEILEAKVAAIEGV